MALVVRPLAEADLIEADRINRVAFGVFFGLEDPATFRGDGEVVRGRFRTSPHTAFAGELDGRLVACGFVMDWGSVAILGPLTVDVPYWGQGIARAMMTPMLDWIDEGGFDFSGLFTHPQSASHIRLYESYGYEMQRITGVMSKPAPAGASLGGAVLYSALSDDDRAAALADCRAVAETIHPGLDLSREIQAVADLGLGDTLVLRRDGAAVGFAVCHHGADTEASSARLMVKFAAVRADDDNDRAAAENFDRLVAACEGLAAARGAPEIVAGTNSGRAGAYGALRRAGYRTFMNGIAMLRPDTDGYNRPDRYVIGDWR